MESFYNHKLSMNKNIILLIFLFLLFVIINKNPKESYANLRYDFCEEYEKNNQHCPYRLKNKIGIIRNHSMNQNNNNNSNNNNNNCATIKPTSNGPEFIMFADKYPVYVKKNDNSTQNICGK